MRPAKLLVLVLAGFLPLGALELALRPFVALDRKPTSIFVPDAELGWKLRPGADDDWAGIRVRVNDKGLRGPELPYERGDALRVLYLGDSVTFGFGLPRAEQAFPFAVERRLEAVLGRDVETVNAAVGGWSPWQQHRYLRDEGLRYAPDVVVIGFVLNDVTEKLGLRRFGGPGIGLQLALSKHSWLDAARERSALVQVATDLGARLRFGDELQEGATRVQQLQVTSLVRDDSDPAVDAAWALTLESLDHIVSLCRERHIPVTLVAFPFAFQLERPGQNAPQRRLESWAAANDLPFLDLLPALAREKTAFLDESHLSASGSEHVGRLLADHLEQAGLVH